MFGIFKKLFDSNEKQLNKAQIVVDKVNDLEKDVSKLGYNDMLEETGKMRAKILKLVDKVPDSDFSSLQSRDYKEPLPEYEQAIVDKLNEFMPRIFAFTREIAKRKMDRRHYDVQILAGVVLAWGNKLIEFKTGEGKTQVFHLPTILYALTGRGAHVVTVNDYLAKRDGEYAGHIMAELGLSVGVILSGESYKFISDEELKDVKGEEVYQERKDSKIQNPGDVESLNLIKCTKKDAYACDVVYGTNNEFGFDYLRSNMVRGLDDIAQKELYYCIVDEVDSILIDEARTPLIISSPGEKSDELYKRFANIIPKLDENKHYTVDEKSRSAVLTDEGIEKVEDLLAVDNLWEDYLLAHHLENALKAYTLFEKDDEYIVKDGKVFIVDQFTGRVLPGRRYSEGLHQAIEAKEGVEIKQESKTLATITFQNFFRLYKILCGGSGTVMTEAEEFYKIYNLESIEIPTNEPLIRKDESDRIYKSQEAKYKAVVEEIKKVHETGQPILVGTTSIDTSEYLSRKLDKEGVKHEVLNAKHHEREAHIVEKAGQKGSVTIATNMAGRGTDIKLGEGVEELGGLYVIGTQRHDARRVDNQLRGRSGRQGEPGISRFFVALDDEIMRIQGGEKVKAFMEMANMPDDIPIENRIVSNAIERAQKRMEGQHFDIRNNLVKYDDVMNQQREIFYTLRRSVISRLEFEEELTDKEYEEMKKFLMENFEREIKSVVARRSLEDTKEINVIVEEFLDFGEDDFIIESVNRVIDQEFPDDLDNIKEALVSLFEVYDREELEETLLKTVEKMWEKVSEDMSKEEMVKISKLIMLQSMDQLWTDHLTAMKDLKGGIGLRGVAQRDPLVEYKNEAFEYFDILMKSIRSRFSRRIFKVKRVKEQPASINIQTNKNQIQDVLTGTREGIKNTVKNYLNDKEKNKKQKATKQKTVVNTKDVGRNDPCPCGSGKKYKKCHGKKW